MFCAAVDQVLALWSAIIHYGRKKISVPLIVQRGRDPFREGAATPLGVTGLRLIGNLQSQILSYSYLNASIGSTFVALRAGT